MSLFEVASLALAPKQHIMFFCNYYFRLGAERITIYYDGKIDDIFEISGVKLIECNDDFWSKRCSFRPNSVEDRQRAVYADAYSKSKSDWLLIVDLDEFVFGEDKDDVLFLGIDKSINSLRFRTVEAVYGPGQNTDIEFGARFFRIQFGRYLGKLIPLIFHPDVAGIFSRGIVGHSIGKHAIRTGLKEVSVGIHDSRIAGLPASELDKTYSNPNNRFYLAHFFAINYTQWLNKWETRLNHSNTSEFGSSGEKMLKLFAKAKKKKRQLKLFESLHKIGKVEIFLMRRIGKIIDNKIIDKL